MKQSKRAAFLLSVAAATFGAVDAAQAQAAAADESSEIVVTGTNIRGIAPTGSQPITVGREDIQQMAKPNTTELLAQIPQLSQFNAVPTASTSFGISVAQVSLRPNLGTGATLVLLNGRRLTPLGITASNPDVSSIPTNAIRNVQVIADGASAVYGSDAVAGVINFVTRKDDKIETSLNVGVSDHHYEQYTFGQTWGKDWDGGNIFVAGEYSWHPRLKGANIEQLSQFLNTTAPATAGSLSCPIATIGASPTKCDTQKYPDILPQEERTSLFGAVTQELNENVQLFGEGIYTRSDRQNRNGPFSLAGGANGTMAANNPYNPTPGTAVQVFYLGVPEVDLGFNVESQQYMYEATAGADIKLPHDWKGTVSVTSGTSSNDYVTPQINNAALRDELASTTAANAFDPFQHRTSAAALVKLFDFTDLTHVDLGMTEVVAKADGALFELPGGKVRLAVGSEFRHDTQEGTRTIGSPTTFISTTLSGYSLQSSADTSRNISSVYGELFIPIIGEGNKIPLFQSVSLSLADRYDDYSDVGSTSNPKYGIDWRLTDDVRVFAEKSTSFQAPNLGSTGAGAVDTRIDPNFGGAAVNGAPTGRGTLASITIAGGSNNLVPQTSKNYSYGFELTPRLIPGLRASVTKYDVNFTNFIAIPGAPCTNPALSQFCPVSASTTVPFAANDPVLTQYTSTLPVTGQLLPTQIFYIQDLRRTNLATQIQDGYDYDVSYRMPAGAGNFTTRLAGTHIHENKTKASPTAALTDQRKISPMDRISLSTDYSEKAWSLGAVLNHGSGYYATATNFTHIKAFDIYNLRASYSPELGGIGKDVRFSFNVDNVFAEPPPLNAANAGGRAVGIQLPADFRGRTIRVGLNKAW